MSNDEACPAIHQGFHPFLNQNFGPGVYRGSRFVKNQNLRIRQEGPRDCQQLLLTLRNIAGIAVDHRLIAVIQRPDEVIDMCCLRRRDDFLIRRIQPSVTKVLHHRSVKQPGILKHHAKQRTQIRPPVIADILTIHIDRTAVQLIEAHQQLNNRRLAGACRTDDRHALAGIDEH